VQNGVWPGVHMWVVGACVIISILSGT